MRKLLYFSMGFAAACGAGSYVLQKNTLLIAGALCLVCAMGLLLLSSPNAKRTGVVLLGCFAGALWLFSYDTLYLGALNNYHEKTADICITARDYGRKTRTGQTVEGYTNLDGISYKIRLYLDTPREIVCGDTIRGEFYLRFTVREKGGYQPGQGVFLLGYARGKPDVVPVDQIPLGYFPAVLRQNVMELLKSIYPEDTLGFAQALVLGETGNLSHGDDLALRQSGIRHVVAVSGLHISIFFSLAYQLCRKQKVLTAAIGIPLLIVFAAVAGFSASVVRACIMQILVILALLCNREYDPPTALSFSALVLLLFNPWSITSVSFQLSVGSMAGIFLISGRIREYLLDEKRLGSAKGKHRKSRAIRWLVGSVSVTVGAMLFTVPMCVYYFGTVSLIGVVTNLLTLGLVSYIFYGILLSCFCGAFFIPLGSAIAWAVSQLIRLVLGIAKVLGGLPYAWVSIDDVYILAWLVFAYVLVVVFSFSSKKRPVMLSVCLLTGFFFSAGFSWLEGRGDAYRVSVLDVGQGQCVLIQSGDDCFVVDCGGDSGEDAAILAAQTLKSQGIYQMTGLILTHYDKDHAGGAQTLMSLMDTDTLYLSCAREPGDLSWELEEAAQAQIHWVYNPVTLPCGTGEISVYPGERGASDNESSLCILFQAANCDILITGDREIGGEQFLLHQAELPDLEILIAGHHGAATSTGLELLQKTRPEVAVLSVGKDNRYGHPAQAVLARLELFGCRVLRTDENGTIVFRG